MNKQRNKSKSGGRASPFADGVGNTRDERHKDRADRIAATKKNSKKKTLRAKYAPPKETAELRAARAEKSREAARKVFEKWLESPAVREFAKNDKGRQNTLSHYVYLALSDALPEPT